MKLLIAILSLFTTISVSASVIDPEAVCRPYKKAMVDEALTTCWNRFDEQLLQELQDFYSSNNLTPISKITVLGEPFYADGYLVDYSIDAGADSIKIRLYMNTTCNRSHLFRENIHTKTDILGRVIEKTVSCRSTVSNEQVGYKVKNRATSVEFMHSETIIGNVVEKIIPVKL